ncbi:transporter, NhaC family [Desulforamulus reducens MI-1]|uniref:Transporter, NhaC family n=1 Tax=Desulforamulus reducens (strain ATCC BAA-1160 / DSM 100696 / MI-1) TaxID=349161 RepID=A4J520_DESRM|nr:Na+/H+ antiporter NhaC family protein [Desulforamulus reducens]ABO50173.1 transporter, NhaC family [Desulforamulus reducens MI-1]
MDYQWLSLIPPVLAIGLALFSKKVIPSLAIGIISGAFILSNYQPVATITKALGMMTEKVTDSWNLCILGFLVILGILVHLVTVAGGSAAYGKWAATKIKTRSGAKLSTFFLGILIFIDDYFNSLTVGTVMRPVTDKYNISRAKLAYVLDATAAPICIIAPVSSWVATIMSTMGDKFKATGLEMEPFSAFLMTIPLNLYAILTIIMVILVSLYKLDFGPMLTHEERAVNEGDLGVLTVVANEEEKVSDKGKVMDLVVPIAGLVVFVLTAMVYTGGYFDGGVSVIGAIKNTDAAKSLLYGGSAALVLSLLMFLPRGVVTVGQLPKAVYGGFMSMLPANLILIFAWTIGGIIGELGTGVYLANQLGDKLPFWVYPSLAFILSGFMAFATGTSWGTFAIMIPIAIDLALIVDPQLLSILMASVLAGAVYGDHCSPISDTTILSSTGAGCKHIDHVSTQLPYASLVGSICFLGYIFSAVMTKITDSVLLNATLTLIICSGLLVISLNVLHRLSTARVEKSKEITV